MKKSPYLGIVTSLLFALAFTLGGCATESVMSTGPKFTPTNPDSVKIYLTTPPTAKYDELGRVSVDKYNNLAIERTGDQVSQLLREKAAAIGGDAVISVTEDFGGISGVVVKFTAAP